MNSIAGKEAEINGIAKRNNILVQIEGDKITLITESKFE